MANISTLADYLSIGPSTARRRRTDALSRELSGLAELGRAAFAAEVCVIGWQTGGGPALVRSPARTPHLEPLGGAGFAMLAGQLLLRPDSRIFRLRAPELSALIGPVALDLAAASASHESASAIAILMTHADRHADEVEPVVELLARAALGAIAADSSASSRDFWRRRSHMLEAELAEARRRAEEAEAERRRIADDAAEISRLKPGELPAGIGRLIAGAGPFEAWIVALSERGELHVEAASPNAPASALVFDAQSALFDSFSRGRPVSRLSGTPPGAPYREDRIFPRVGFSSYLCLPLGLPLGLPFASGVIALAARESIDPAAAKHAEAIAWQARSYN